LTAAQGGDDNDSRCAPQQALADDHVWARAPQRALSAQAEAEGGSGAATGAVERPDEARHEREEDAIRLLLVEDEQALASAIARGLRRIGMAVDLAFDGPSGLEKATVNDYDVIVLDRNLPGLHGDEVCRRLVEEQVGARILMLTAATGVDDRVSGLDLGADDYLGKPFAFEELVARIRALGRRAGASRPPVLHRGKLELDPATHRARRSGRDLKLTRKEFGVLEALLGAEGAVVSSEELLEKVWDENTDPFTNVVRVTVMTLRRKLGDPAPIETVTGVGYRLP